MKKLVVITWENPRTRESGTVSENGAYKTFDSKEPAEKFLQADERLPVKGDKFQMVYEVKEIWMREKAKPEAKNTENANAENANAENAEKTSKGKK